MQHEDMINFFDHIGNQQTSHGIRDAFRFKAVLSSRKKGDLGGAKYRDPPQTLIFNMGAMNDSTQTTALNIGVINNMAPDPHTNEELASSPPDDPPQKKCP